MARNQSNTTNARNTSPQKLSLTNEQNKAIAHSKGHLMIIACPGSGKTEVVSRRIAKLIQSGANPKTIVAFTFTEKAAEELKTRIRKILDEEAPDRADFGDMFVGTIHAFCFYMLKELDPVYRSYDVLDDPKRVAFLSKPNIFYDKVNLDALAEKHNLKPYRAIDHFIYSADVVMTENIDVDNVTDKQFVTCYKRYRKALDSEKYFDFSTVLDTFVSAVKNDAEKQKLLRQKIKHVVLDEYQDVNKIQEMLLSILSKGSKSVCVVGDDDQNIYHWRGSNVEIIRSFNERYGKKYKVSEVHLNTNFRSTEAVVYTARKFIENNVKRLSKSMISNANLQRKYERGDIVVRHFDRDHDEFKFLVSKIKELVRTEFIDKQNRKYSLSLGDMAILVRTNEDAANIVRFLDENDIDCISFSGRSIFDHPEVSLAMDCIGYVFNCRGYTTDQVPQINALSSRYEQTFSQAEFQSADVSKFVTKLKKIRRQADLIYKKSPKDYLPGLGFQEFYHKILNAMGAEEFDFGDVYNYNLAALSKAVSDYESVWTRLRAKEITGFFYFVFAYAESHYGETQHNNVTNINAVRVLTIHKAKGLEFSAVFVPNLVDKRKPIPHPSFVDPSLYDLSIYNGSIEDERRTFYTAITRSEKYLFLTGSKNRTGRQKKYNSHPFIFELDKKFVSDILSTPKPRSKIPSRTAVKGVFPTSFSQLSCYGRCPHDYKMRHVLGFNAGVPVTFGYGTNIHHVLNWIHRRYLDKGRAPDVNEIEKGFDRIFKMRYATKKISDNMKRAGKRVVNNYVKIHKDDFKRILETEKNFEFVIDDALVSGQIDLLKKIDEKGNVAEVEIIDFKTDKKDGVYTLDHEKQLRYYAIACLKSLGLKPEKAYVHLLDSDKKHYVDITEDILEDTKAGIKKEVSSIIDKKFPANPTKSHCSECDYRAICPFKKFRVGVDFTN